MTNKEAIKALRLEGGLAISGNARKIAEFMQALDVAISAIRRVEWEDTLWHDAKTDQPKAPGLYYGKKDYTNSMYAVNYQDGVWTLSCYPDHKMDILQWAEYAAFRRDEDDQE